MAIYRVFPDDGGESHIEEIKLEDHPELAALINVSEVRVQQFDGSRHMDFHPTDGTKVVLRAGDIRLMEDVAGKGHSHNDLTPSAAVYVLLED